MWPSFEVWWDKYGNALSRLLEGEQWTLNSSYRFLYFIVILVFSKKFLFLRFLSISRRLLTSKRVNIIPIRSAFGQRSHVFSLSLSLSFFLWFSIPFQCISLWRVYHILWDGHLYKTFLQTVCSFIKFYFKSHWKISLNKNLIFYLEIFKLKLNFTQMTSSFLSFNYFI